MSRASETTENRRRPSIAWWVGLSVLLALPVLGGMLLSFWVYDHAPRWVYWRAALWVLIALQVAYDAVVAACLITVPFLAIRIYRARRRGLSRPTAARGLLLGIATLFALGIAEGAAALRQILAHRAAAIPVGGLRPSAPAEDPPPTTFPEEASDGTVTLAVLGESSAVGVPYDSWLSVPAIVRWQLEEAIPGRRFEVQSVARSGETLERQYWRLDQLRRRPDAVIVYCGHNELSSRLPAGRELAYYHDGPPPSLWESFSAWTERVSPLSSLIRNTADKCRIAVPPRPEDVRALVDSPGFTAAEISSFLTNFRRRLEQIVTYAEQLGAIPILVIPPGNDSGFEPNRSYLPATTPYAEREAVAREFLAARRLEETDPGASEERYRALVARHPGFAEAHYRLARVLERTGAWEEAYRHDVTARDRDGMPVRCSLAFQEAYREVAARHACILVDSQTYFHAIGRHGLLDDGLFHDAMHPSLRGQIALAQGVLAGLKAWGAFGWPEATPAPVIDPARCADHFGLAPEPWKRLCLWGMMIYQILTPLHYDPTGRRAKAEGFRQAFLALEAGRPPESTGLPNVGIPPAVPLVPEAAILTGAAARRGPL